MKNWFRNVLILMCFSLLSACGDTQHSSTTGGTMKAVLKMTAGVAAQNMAGFNLIISVSNGVSTPLLADNTATAAGTVEIVSSTALGDSAQRGYTYVPSTTGATGQLSVFAIKADGFTDVSNDQVIIHLNVADGVIPVASDFKLIYFDAFDIDGKIIASYDAATGVQTGTIIPTLTTTIQ